MKRRTFLKSSGAVLVAAAIPASMSSMSRMDEITREALRIAHKTITGSNVIYIDKQRTPYSGELMLSMKEFEEAYIEPAIRAIHNDLFSNS